ncbi:hypothetical protein [Tumebacillus flagellatus]|uniref:DUF4878 domain-containing protein n=1 Tax=Tumebacillus flagellatus TaxID=1157490 RepID=A0A074LST0_9BACL|nr:hypothetical protein [Tumebacillus flagellatus]KEO83545.1 hypothetical protein EL26_09015 [Tumebacillus flagellatus]
MKKALALGLLAVLATTLIGCGSSTATSSNGGDTATKQEAVKSVPEDAVKGFLDSLKKVDLTGAAAYTEDNNKDMFSSEETKESQQVLNDMLSALTYEIGEVKADGNKATVAVKISAVDFTNLMQTVMSDMMTEAMSAALADPTKQPDQAEMEKKAQDAVAKAAKDPSAPKKNTDLTIDVKKKGDKWVIVNNDNNSKLIAAAFGLDPSALE